MSKNTIDHLELFDIQKSAAFLGVSAGTIRRWAHTKQVKGMKVGVRGDWRFTKDELLKMAKLNPSSEQTLQEATQKTTLPITPKTQEEEFYNAYRAMLSQNETHPAMPTLAPRLDWQEMGKSEHFVQFYESDTILMDSLSKFIGMGLYEGDTCIVVATQKHRQSLEDQLQTYGLNLIAAKKNDQYKLLDASELLSTFIVDGLPNPLLFLETVGDIVDKAIKRGKHVRIFGEMVALLWAEGNQTTAVQLEKLWNDLGNHHSFALYCAYPMHGFDKEIHGMLFKEIGLHHARLIPAESYNDLVTPDERLRAISLLQQKAESLEAEIKERKKLEKQKDEFLSIASHELKTPVTSIKAYTQALQLRLQKKGDEDSVKYLTKMDNQINKLTELITDLLDVTKIESGQLIMRKEKFSLSDVTDDVIEQLQLITNKHHLRKMNTTQKMVYGDKDRLSQVLANFLSNAIKYSPDADTIDIGFSEDKDSVTCYVRDYGIGIPEDKQTHVFERFYRVSGPKELTFPGLGLGLYISSEIMKRHEGKVWVESEQGKGSTFAFSLLTV